MVSILVEGRWAKALKRPEGGPPGGPVEGPTSSQLGSVTTQLGWGSGVRSEQSPRVEEGRVTVRYAVSIVTLTDGMVKSCLGKCHDSGFKIFTAAGARVRSVRLGGRGDASRAAAAVARRGCCVMCSQGSGSALTRRYYSCQDLLLNWSGSALIRR